MPLSAIILVVWAFLQGSLELGWFTVSATFLGVLLVAFAIVRLLELAHPFEVPVRPIRRTTE